MFMNQTIISDMVLKIIPQGQAATVLSFQSLVRRLLYAFVAPILGIFYDTFGIQKALFGYALLLCGIFAILLVMKERIDERKRTAIFVRSDNS
jgi:MFS-type transporter involved in bile tolerance (Atg22 family)